MIHCLVNIQALASKIATTSSRPIPLPLAMAATKRAYHDKLLDIGSIARSMNSLCRVDPPPQPLISTDTATVTIPPLSLPNPDAIIPLLLSQGCPQTVAQILSDTFIHSAHQTRVKFESNYQKTCTKLAPHLMSDPVAQAVRFKSLSSLVELRYQDQISAIKGLALERFKAHQKPTVENNVAKPKPTFNQASSYPTHMYDSHFIMSFRSTFPCWRNISNTMRTRRLLIG